MSQTSNNSLLITPAGPFNCGLSYGTNEFAIIGDELAVTSDNTVPDWFVNIVGGIVNTNVQNLYDSMLNYNSNLLGALGQIEVAKNTYAQYISKVITDESAYVAALTTLNANIQGNDATIKQLLQTYATSDYAVASAAQLLTASLNGGAIGAKIGSAESAMATQYGAMAQRLDQLDTAFHDTSSQINSTASAVQKLTTYTGLGTSNGLPAVIANSNFYRTLNAYLDGTNYGTVGGTSTLLHDVTTISTAEAATVEAKFEYGSTIHLDGKDYKAGFGLVQTGTVSADGTTYNSEFWIDASKFKFTNSSKTGQISPFTIDASGTTPQITFSGNVLINNRSTAIPGGLPKFLGSYASPPTAIVSGDTYKNTSTNIVYVWDSSSWVTTQGANSTSVTLLASTQGVGYDVDGTHPSVSYVYFTTQVDNYTKGDTLNYTFYLNDSIVLSGPSTVSSYIGPVPSNISDFLAPKKVSVKVTSTLFPNDISEDYVSIYATKSGSDALIVILSNENHTIPVSNVSGTITYNYSGSGTKITVYRGTELIRVGSGNNQFTVSALGSSISVGSRVDNADGTVTYYDSSNITATTATITFTITYKNAAGTPITVTRQQSINKTVDGTNGSRGTGFGVSTASYASDSAFTASTGFPYAMDGDQLLLTNNNGSQFYKRQSGSWSNNTALLVDGNAIINGMALVKGKLLTGNGIESSTYTAGSSGWKISADGSAEFNSITARVNARDIIGALVMSKTSGQTTGYSIDGGHGCATELYIDTQHLYGKLLSVTVIVTATGNNSSYDHFYNVGVVAEGYVQGGKVCRAVNTSGYELSVTAVGTGYVVGGGTIVASGLSHDYFYPMYGFTVNVTAIVTLA